MRSRSAFGAIATFSKICDILLLQSGAAPSSAPPLEDLCLVSWGCHGCGGRESEQQRRLEPR